LGGKLGFRNEWVVMQSLYCVVCCGKGVLHLFNFFFNYRPLTWALIML